MSQIGFRVMCKYVRAGIKPKGDFSTFCFFFFQTSSPSSYLRFFLSVCNSVWFPLTFHLHFFARRRRHSFGCNVFFVSAETFSPHPHLLRAFLFYMVVPYFSRRVICVHIAIAFLPGYDFDIENQGIQQWMEREQVLVVLCASVSFEALFELRRWYSIWRFLVAPAHAHTHLWYICVYIKRDICLFYEIKTAFYIFQWFFAFLFFKLLFFFIANVYCVWFSV